jgi:tetratricopeptide (TPR) repeat protein
MRAFVFTDKALERYAGRFVWLAIDTENGKNSKFLQKYPVHALPTLYVIDPKREAAVIHYVGGATVPQLTKLLNDGESAYRAKSQSPADALLASAEKLAAEGLADESIKLYQQAIAKAPKSWPRFSRAAESYVVALAMKGDSAACAEEARTLYPRLKGTPSGANIASAGLSCATELDEKNPKRAELLASLEPAVREAFDDTKIVMSGDDRSGIFSALVDAREAAKDEAGAKKLRQDWIAFLEQEAAKANTAEQRAVYDPHRLSLYIEAKTPEKAIPMLEQTERDFPNDYNPPARLAAAYKAMGKYDEALAAIDRALAKSYGPRRIGQLRTRADILIARGDKEGARKTLQEAIAYAKALPSGQRSERTIAALEKKLSDVPQ